MFATRLLPILCAAPFAAPALATQADARSAAAGHAAHAPAAAAASATAPGASWTRLPILLAGRTPPGDRSAARFLPRNLDATTIEVFAPAAKAGDARTEVTVGPEGAEFRAPKGQGNYYWISARQQTKEGIVTASTVRYFSNPGPAPTELLLQRKSVLELIPQPLPREHSYYRAGEGWEFLVRHRSQPLPDATVVLETEHGTRTVFKSDARGIVRIVFPNDFRPQTHLATGEHAGHGPPRAGFVLAAEHTDGGVHHLTAFNYLYAPDVWERKSLWAGVGFAVLGMALAAPLLRRKPKTA